MLECAPPALTTPDTAAARPASRCRPAMYRAAALLLALLCLRLSKAVPGDSTSQQGLQSSALGGGAAAARAADFCAGADEAPGPHGWTRFPSAPGIPGHLLDATLLQALASAAQHTAWQPCSRGGLTVLLEGCQQVSNMDWLFRRPGVAKVLGGTRVEPRLPLHAGCKQAAHMWAHMCTATRADLPATCAAHGCNPQAAAPAAVLSAQAGCPAPIPPCFCCRRCQGEGPTTNCVLHSPATPTTWTSPS